MKRRFWLTLAVAVIASWFVTGGDVVIIAEKVPEWIAEASWIIVAFLLLDELIPGRAIFSN
jgi:hypothetical protein